MIYKDKLKNIRESKGLSQKELASILLVSPFTFSHYENEQDIMPIKHLNSLCNYFNVSLDYILGFSNKANYETSNKEIDFIVSSQRLKEFRKENKLTQVKLAEILNASPSVVVHHENKRHLIATPFLYTICRKFNISADYLLGKVDAPKYLK